MELLFSRLNGYLNHRPFGRGFVLIQFQEEQDADHAIEFLNERYYHRLYPEHKQVAQRYLPTFVLVAEVWAIRRFKNALC